MILGGTCRTVLNVLWWTGGDKMSLPASDELVKFAL
jgi:hypothetical protein